MARGHDALALVRFVMPVTWKHPGSARWTTAALAVPCGTCGAYIGKPCTLFYSQGAPRDPHPQRAEAAEAYGFTFTEPAAAPLFEFRKGKGGDA